MSFDFKARDRRRYVRRHASNWLMPPLPDVTERYTPLQSVTPPDGDTFELDRAKGCGPTTLVNQHSDNPAQTQEAILPAATSSDGAGPDECCTFQGAPPDGNSGDRQCHCRHARQT